MTIAERDQPLGPPSPASSGGVRGSGGGEGQRQQQEQQLCPYPADPAFDELGYKVLLYLKRCFRGRVLGAAEPLSDAETAKVGWDARGLSGNVPWWGRERERGGR